MGRRRWAWIAGGFGLVALLRGLARRRPREEEPPLAFAPDAAVPTEPEPDPRAEELRTRLDQAKATEDDRDDFDAGETPVDADPDARRRDVHDEARAAIDEMAGPSAEE